MNCLTSNNDLQYSYTWVKKNDAITSRAQGINSSTLTILYVLPEDSGDYQCTVSNRTGKISSNFSTVSVIGKETILKNNTSCLHSYVCIAVSAPTITIQPVNINVSVYKSASFKCTAHGFQLTKILWKRINYTLPATADIITETSFNTLTSTLMISEIIGYYSGWYYCIAENAAGKVASHIAKLHVTQSKLCTMDIMLIIRCITVRR